MTAPAVARRGVPKPEMPIVRQSAKIEVRTPPEVPFDVVAADLLADDDDPDSMQGQRPLDDGPLREGFRWRQRIVHNRHLCRADWRVARIQRPRIVEQTMVHFCAEAQREVRGGERWEFRSAERGRTTVELHSWRIDPGLTGWLTRVFGGGLHTATEISLQRRLAYLQFEAERRSATRQ